jgi:ATP-dependent DNA helicase RecQ
MGGGARVMIATNAFGMGVDKPDIGLIVHAQMPPSLEAYCQEIGRAGRDGAAAQCVLLFREGDRALQQFFASGRNPHRDQLAAVWQALRAKTSRTAWLPAALAAAARVPVHRTKQILAALGAVRAVSAKANGGLRVAASRQPDAEVVMRAHQQLDAREGQSRDGIEAMVMYAKSGSCRWQLLMDHFGQTLASPRCGHCDVCHRLDALHQAVRAAPVEAAAQRPQPTRRPFEPGAAVVVRRFGRGVVKQCSTQAVAIEFEDHGLREIDPEFVVQSVDT